MLLGVEDAQGQQEDRYLEVSRVWGLGFRV